MLETLAARVGTSVLLGKLGKAHIPQWVWLLVAGVLLAVGGFWFHSSKVSSFEKSIRDDQQIKDHDKYQIELKAAHTDAEKWKKTFTDAASKITTQESSDHEKAVSDHAGLAGRLRANAATGSYRGQVDNPGSNTSPSGHDTGLGTTVDAQLGAVPNDTGAKLISVPLDDLITFAQHHDDNFDETVTWRKDKVQQENLYKTLLSDGLSGK